VPGSESASYSEAALHSWHGITSITTLSSPSLPYPPRQSYQPCAAAVPHHAALACRRHCRPALPANHAHRVLLLCAAHAGAAAGKLGEGVQVSASLDSALELLAGAELGPRVETVFVIGGGQVYKECMESPLLSAIHLTQVLVHVHMVCALVRICAAAAAAWALSVAAGIVAREQSLLMQQLEMSERPWWTCMKWQ
jgi:hypothetical protein